MSSNSAYKENIPPRMEDDDANKENISPMMEVEAGRGVGNVEWFEFGGDWMFLHGAMQRLLRDVQLRGPTKETLEGHIGTLEEMRENILGNLLGSADLEPLVIELSAMYDDYIEIERRLAEERLMLFPMRREN